MGKDISWEEVDSRFSNYEDVFIHQGVEAARPKMEALGIIPKRGQPIAASANRKPVSSSVKARVGDRVRLVGEDTESTVVKVYRSIATHGYPAEDRYVFEKANGRWEDGDASWIDSVVSSARKPVMSSVEEDIELLQKAYSEEMVRQNQGSSVTRDYSEADRIRKELRRLQDHLHKENRKQQYSCKFKEGDRVSHNGRLGTVEGFHVEDPNLSTNPVMVWVQFDDHYMRTDVPEGWLKSIQRKPVSSVVSPINSCLDTGAPAVRLIEERVKAGRCSPKDAYMALICDAKASEVEAQQTIDEWFTARKFQIASSLKGTIDERLAGAYLRGANLQSLPQGLQSLGEGGRVVLTFQNDGKETQIDLGGNLESGYIVGSLLDDLGLFPDTNEGDLLPNSDIMNIIQKYGQKDSKSITSSASFDYHAHVKQGLQSGKLTPEEAFRILKDAGYSDNKASAIVEHWSSGSAVTKDKLDIASSAKKGVISSCGEISQRRAVMSRKEEVLSRFVRLNGSEELFSGFASLQSNGSFGCELFVPILGRGFIMQGARKYITSSYGLRINSFDELVSKTTGLDVCCLTAFTGMEKRFVAENPNPEYGQVGDREQYLREHKAQSQERYAQTDALWKDLNTTPFGVLSIDGLYKESTGYESKEKSFMVVNTEGIPSVAFFDTMSKLGNKYGQMSVLVKAGSSLSYRGQEMTPEVAYWMYLEASSKKGTFDEQGRLNKVNIEQFLKVSSEFGGSRFHSGQGFRFSSVSLIGVDFSGLVVSDQQTGNNYVGCGDLVRRPYVRSSAIQSSVIPVYIQKEFLEWLKYGEGSIAKRDGFSKRRLVESFVQQLAPAEHQKFDRISDLVNGLYTFYCRWSIEAHMDAGADWV